MIGFVARPTERSRDRLFQRCFADYDAARECGWPLHVIEDAADDPAAEQPEAFLLPLHATLTAA